MRRLLAASIIVIGGCRSPPSHPGGQTSPPPSPARGSAPLAFTQSAEELENLSAPWPAARGYLGADGAVLYVPTDAGEVIALDVETGKQRWKRPSLVLIRGLHRGALAIEIEAKGDVFRPPGSVCRGDQLRVVIVGPDGEFRLRSAPLAAEGFGMVVPFDSEVSQERIQVAWCNLDAQVDCHPRRWSVGLDGHSAGTSPMEEERHPHFPVGVTATREQAAHLEHASGLVVAEFVVSASEEDSAELTIRKDPAGESSVSLVVEAGETAELHLAHRHAREAYLVLIKAKSYFRLDLASMTLSPPAPLVAPLLMGAVVQDRVLIRDSALTGPRHAATAIKARRLSDGAQIWHTLISEESLPGAPLTSPTPCSPSDANG